MTDPPRKQLPATNVEQKSAERIEQEQRLIEVGQWYWVDEHEEPEDEEEEEKPEPWIGCVTHIGSNYVRLVHVNGYHDLRVHLDEFDDYLTRELDPEGVLNGKIQHYRDKVSTLMGKVKAVTARLGVSPRLGISQTQESETFALVTATDQTNAEDYETALVKAKDEELPALFEEIKEANESLALWMKASVLPLLAQAEGMKGCVKEIESRIFNVSLYAGLTEDVTQVCEGDPADFDEKLHLLQRRLYMDEECLLDYQNGGMEFKSIGKFDGWISKPKNLNRILPHPRCMVAMRVRRERKNRYAESIFQAVINIQLGELDELTFLYIRNGDQLYRMNCDLEFDELIFPSKNEFDPSQSMMFTQCGGKVELITRGDYDERLADYKARVAGDKRWKKENPLRKWAKANPDKTKGRKGTTLTWAWHDANPYVTGSWGEIRDNPERIWEAFSPASVYYDEVVASIKKRVDYYNRLALIIQGLYDRSPVLHPHPPVQTWTPEGFEAAVELVYDTDRSLHAGEKPAFEAYAARLRESIDNDSVVIGQEEAWLKHVQEKEQNSRRWDSYSSPVSELWRPNGDDGPGFMSGVLRIRKKAEKATFRWKRERLGKGWRDSEDDGDLILTTFAVLLEKLFNVSAYKPGDYLQFFNDPRTREEYIQWAPQLLSAEDYHAGKLCAQGAAEKDSNEPDLEEISNRICAHLKRMEGDESINWWNYNGEDRKRFYCAQAVRTGRYCNVSYVNYQSSTALTKGKAWKYLQWLDNGNNGTHHNFENNKPLKRRKVKKAKKKKKKSKRSKKKRP